MSLPGDFEPVIGLEAHAQLRTRTKIFCGCEVVYGDAPNTHTCPVCLGLPGALPVLNQQAVEYAIAMILAVGGEVQGHSVFARKNYFYPDLPKGYQISQFNRPIGTGGAVRYELRDGSERECRLIRIHLEEDAGKLIHPEDGGPWTQVDLNRCGAPLIEIVSEPDIKSGEEAHSYLSRLKQILQYLGICSGDMEKGHLRCDANVSVRPRETKELGTRTEVKNMNSFRAVERALEFEIKRQIEVIRSGGEVEQVTLMWNDDRQTATMMRSKEESHDYRYFPEPDLLPLLIDEQMLCRIRASLPELADERARRLVSQFGIREYDAGVLTASRVVAEYFEEVLEHFTDARAVANWMITELLGALKERKEEIDNCRVRPPELADLLARIKSGEISGKIAKTVFAEMIETGEEPGVIIEHRGLAQISDEKQLRELVCEVIENNRENVDAYRSGKTKLFGFFVGQVMKETGGRANPAVVNRLLKKQLGGGD